MKKSIPIIRERESEAFILGNGRKREFPLTPGKSAVHVCISPNLDEAVSFKPATDARLSDLYQLMEEVPLAKLQLILLAPFVGQLCSICRIERC